MGHAHTMVKSVVAAAVTVAVCVLALFSIASSAGASSEARQAAANANFVGEWASLPTTWVITGENLRTGVCKGPPVGAYKLAHCKVTGHNYKFTLSYAGAVYSNSGLISGNRARGTSVGPNGTLKYTVHHVVVCIVPRLNNVTLAAAKKALHKNHCSIRVEKVPSRRARAGRIFYSSPSAGQWAKKNTKVFVDVSTG